MNSGLHHTQANGIIFTPLKKDTVYQQNANLMEKSKVLVIDDDPTTCNLLETVLQMENYQTTAVNSIGNGDIVSLLQGEKPQLLILDFHLDGEEALKYILSIRANSDWKELPIVITSAIDRRQDCMDAGANEFVLKPFNWQEIIDSINKVRNNFMQQEV